MQVRYHVKLRFAVVTDLLTRLHVGSFVCCLSVVLNNVHVSIYRWFFVLLEKSRT